MGYQESSDFCWTCKRQVLTRRETANHVLHAILTLVTCFWGLIWITLAMSPGRWRCSVCGLEIHEDPRRVAAGR